MIELKEHSYNPIPIQLFSLQGSVTRLTVNFEILSSWHDVPWKTTMSGIKRSLLFMLLGAMCLKPRMMPDLPVSTDEGKWHTELQDMRMWTVINLLSVMSAASPLLWFVLCSLCCLSQEWIHRLHWMLSSTVEECCHDNFLRSFVDPQSGQCIPWSMSSPPMPLWHVCTLSRVYCVSFHPSFLWMHVAAVLHFLLTEVEL